MATREILPFVKDNKAYEKWLVTQCDVVKKDLDHKHKRMRRNDFDFLRATYFRWAKQIGIVCPELENAPRALCVGDIHLENFGTWRDAEGRLVWGVNDFDEAAEMPYAFDLVRLAASARLARNTTLHGRDIADSILDGYCEGLAHPRPTLLDEQEQWMRDYVACTDKERAVFLSDVKEYPQASPSRKIQAGLLHSLPKDATLLHYSSRVAGGGSLGRPRYVALAAYRGGHVVREAKALVPSAWTWAHGLSHPKLMFLQLARGAHRSPDPFLDVHDDFVFRRLAADSRKVELSRPGGICFAPKLLRAMGFDLAAIHAASPGNGKALRADLRNRPNGWLRTASKRAAKEVSRDYKDWKKAS